MKKILLTKALNFDKDFKEKVEKLGFKIFYHEDEEKNVPKEYLRVDGVVCNNLFIKNDISKFKNLKFIHLTSAGIDRLPGEKIKRMGIKVFTAKNVYAIPISEWVIMRILEIYKKVREFEKRQKEHRWEKIRDIEELTDKVAGILGYGNIGKEVARRLKPFGVKIYVCDIKKSADKNVDLFFSFEKLDIFLNQLDILILTLPLTKKTKGLIDIKKMDLMKNGSVIINVSRGAIIKIKDLKKVLQSGKFKGVYLDVFEEEPLPEDDPLWDYKNVYITPHNSFVSEKIKNRLLNLIFKNLKKMV